MEMNNMYGEFIRDLSFKKYTGSRWLWMWRSDLNDLKTKTKSITCVVQEQYLWINYVRCKINNKTDCDKCRLCCDRGKIVWHTVSECLNLAQRSLLTEDM